MKFNYDVLSCGFLVFFRRILVQCFSLILENSMQIIFKYCCIHSLCLFWDFEYTYVWNIFHIVLTVFHMSLFLFSVSVWVFSNFSYNSKKKMYTFSLVFNLLINSHLEFLSSNPVFFNSTVSIWGLEIEPRASWIYTYTLPPLHPKSDFFKVDQISYSNSLLFSWTQSMTNNFNIWITWSLSTLCIISSVLSSDFNFQHVLNSLLDVRHVLKQL